MISAAKIVERREISVAAATIAADTMNLIASHMLLGTVFK